ncbi:MAG: DUF4834 family protein [Prevotellaceae bacterium]|nr:DUF4834 family protein [Prevotellaceae bacterium]
MLFPVFGFFFFLLLLVVLFLGLTFIGSILQALFFSGKRRARGNSNRRTQTSGNQAASQGRSGKAARKKLFAPDEGEYVEFEEIKEEE